MPPYMRCAYKCNKDPTEWKGDENREKLQEGLKEQALAIPDQVEQVKWEKGEQVMWLNISYIDIFVSGVVRGKVYVPKVEEVIKPEYDSDDEDEKKKVVEEDPADLDDEYR
jgi:hypothetical protein